jgi:hypothetical protein
LLYESKTSFLSITRKIRDFETKEKLAEAIDIVKRQADLVNTDLSTFKIEEEPPR